ncbi:MAG: pyridoxal phosphate-dependent aminotransferase [Clostridiales bacterium]|nr:pyridoxal phosphate-dependent aminotransferase [Clostridiales bacterium]
MFDFDFNPERRGTSSMKWDIAENELPMWVADMDFTTAPCVTEALVNRAKHGVFGYAIVPDKWYEAIISWWNRRHNFTIDKSWLQFCTGIVPAISCIVKRITNLGDRVAVLTPAFDIFYHSIENAGRTVKECKLAYSDGKYGIDFGNLEEVLSHPLTTMLIFCNPHNPTGNIWSREEIAKVGALCKKHGVTVLSDEIHCDLTAPGFKYIPFASVSEDCAQNSITCISASKAFNFAGLQSAAVVVPNVHLREKIVRGLNSDEVAEPNCFAVEGTVAAFNEGEEWLEELKKYLAQNRKYVNEYLEKHLPEVKAIQANATYVVWIDCSSVTGDSDGLCEFLRAKTGLILSSGKQYRGNGATFVRMNTACNRERLRDGLERFVKGVKEYIDRHRV